MSALTQQTKQTIRYTVGELFKLNTGQINTNSELHKRFDGYPEPRISNYLNKHNRRFYSEIKKDSGPKTFLNKAHEFDDSAIIEDIRKIVSCISRGGGKTKVAISRMNELSIPGSQGPKIAELFHTSMIECHFLIDEYMDVLYGFSNSDMNLMVSIYNNFVKYVVTEFRKPSKFSDSHTESGADKSHRWRLHNCRILAKLFCRKLPANSLFDYSREMLTVKDMQKRFLDKIVSKLDSKDINTVLYLIEAWSVVLKSGTADESIVTKYRNVFQSIMNSSEYGSSVKAQVMDFTDDDD